MMNGSPRPAMACASVLYPSFKTITDSFSIILKNLTIPFIISPTYVKWDIPDVRMNQNGIVVQHLGLNSLFLALSLNVFEPIPQSQFLHSENGVTVSKFEGETKQVNFNG